MERNCNCFWNDFFSGIGEFCYEICTGIMWIIGLLFGIVVTLLLIGYTINTTDGWIILIVPLIFVIITILLIKKDIRDHNKRIAQLKLEQKKIKIMKQKEWGYPISSKI